MSVSIKTAQEIELMRESGHLLEKVHDGLIPYIKPGMKHAIKADTELHIIEVQVGDELAEEDIERFDWDWSQDGF